MASLLAARSAVGGKTTLKACRSKNVARRMVCRAEEKSVAKVDRSKDVLYVGASEASLKYLDGSLPGDYGFDPLGLSDPEIGKGGFIDADWLKYSEVFHCRWAMLGAAGCIAPEILGKLGMIPPETAIVWFRSGVIPPAGTYDKYWTDPYSLFYLEIIAMQFAELRRLQDYRKPGSMGKQFFLSLEASQKGSGNPAYPGGPWFNMLNLGGKSAAEMDKLKRNEVENGRLAMIAVFGYGAQAVMTGKGPFENLVDHLSDPVNNNILVNFQNALAH